MTINDLHLNMRANDIYDIVYGQHYQDPYSPEKQFTIEAIEKWLATADHDQNIFTLALEWKRREGVTQC